MEIILEGLDKYFVVECALASRVQYQSALSFSKSESSAGAAHECQHPHSQPACLYSAVFPTTSFPWPLPKYTPHL